jgi:hypothetical protein
MRLSLQREVDFDCRRDGFESIRKSMHLFAGFA